MSELIDRQDVLHELDWCDYGLKDWQKWKLKMMVRDIQSAQPEPQWIPCSERLPEDDRDYLVTIKYRVMNKPICTISSYANDLYEVDDFDFKDKKGKSGWYYDDSEYGYGEVTNVIAWMPLPEPYKENADD